ncbi:MlaD family protein [Arundinibacter roseus]|uniref:MCE family protein n=1 Tax=Arundinibacter roseus TaxID=2070510 RepID=A0A4R4KJS0_9BACT|nr:MlaD family protein [Arundinibacter roseus]TDB68233.1 MCE family protein [Arundinibacter roseus]
MSATPNPQRRAVMVGLFVLIGLIIFIAGILTIGSMRKSFVSKITTHSVFDDVNGLQAGNNIWFSGVKVGTVKEIRFSGTSQVEVVMNIEEKSRQYIRKDATVKISSDGLIGNKIIVISGGTPKAEPIEEGDELTVEREDSQQDIMNTLQANNKNILAITTDFKEISRKIAKGEGSVGKLLADEQLYKSLETTMTSLQKSAVQAQNLTVSLNTYAAKLNQKGGLANDVVTDTIIMHQVRLAVSELNQTANTARALVSGLQKTTEEVSASLTTDTNSPVGVMLNDETTATTIKSTVKNLESSSQKLNESMEALQNNFLLRGFFRKKEKREAKEVRVKADSIKLDVVQ